MAENKATQTQQTPQPNPDLKSFEKLVGTWKVSGGLVGTINFGWAEGGFFLIQRFDMMREEHPLKGIEIIGHEKGITGEESAEIKSKTYSFTDGMTLDYVYEMDGDDLTIWMDRKGSDGYMNGKISDGGKRMDIEWFYPGGGYTASGVKVK